MMAGMAAVADVRGAPLRDVAAAVAAAIKIQHAITVQHWVLLTVYSIMHIQTIYPQHLVLQKHIAFYYFIKTTDPDFCSRYYAFPNVNNGLTIHRSAIVNVENNCLDIMGCHSNQYLTVLQSRYEKPLQVMLKGIIDEITIVFKPLGINNFTTKSFAELTGDIAQKFTDWDSATYQNLLVSFFETDDVNVRVRLLEKFLMAVYQPFTEQNLMEQAINLIADIQSNLSMDEVADKLFISTRTLHRLFKKHLGLSPIAYRMVTRFRQSLSNKLINDYFKLLTEVGYESNYYDQSYFNKVYKKLTGTNPKNFFEGVDYIGHNKPLFKYI
jgi:AraC-like DNA-binding protein